MCLYTRQIMPTKARKDIVCYKIVRRYPHKTGKKKYKTPCTRISIKCFSMYTAENLSPNGQNNKIKVATNTAFIRLTKIADLHKYHAHPFATSMNLMMYCVDKGYIHCCTTIEDCKKWIHVNYNLFPHNKKAAFHWGIMKCIIPKGTLYYKSYDGTQVCAKTLKTTKIVLQG